MSIRHSSRADWIVGALGVLLLIDLLELPWHTVGGGTVSGIVLPSISEPATGSPDAWLGVLAVLAILAAVLDLAVQHLSPDTQLPAVSGSRSMTRFALAVAGAVFLALKFLFHITSIGNLGVGFWLGVVLTAAFVFVTAELRGAGPTVAPERPARPQPRGTPADRAEDERERPSARTE